MRDGACASMVADLSGGDVTEGGTEGGERYFPPSLFLSSLLFFLPSFLSIYWVSLESTKHILGTWNTLLNKKSKDPSACGSDILAGETDNTNDK